MRLQLSLQSIRCTSQLRTYRDPALRKPCRQQHQIQGDPGTAALYSHNAVHTRATNLMGRAVGAGLRSPAGGAGRRLLAVHTSMLTCLVHLLASHPACSWLVPWQVLTRLWHGRAAACSRSPGFCGCPPTTDLYINSIKVGLARPRQAILRTTSSWDVLRYWRCPAQHVAMADLLGASARDAAHNSLLGLGRRRSRPRGRLPRSTYPPPPSPRSLITVAPSWWAA